MFLLCYWFPRITRYSRYSLFRCSFMKNIRISFNRQPSFGFWRWNIILTFCWCGMTGFVCFYLLLRILINVLILTLKWLIIFITSLGVSAGCNDILLMDRSGSNNNENSSNQEGEQTSNPSDGQGPNNDDDDDHDDNNEDDEVESNNTEENESNDSGISVDSASPRDIEDYYEDEGIDRGRELPSEDDINTVDGALNGNPDDIESIRQKYEAFFDDPNQSLSESLEQVRDYIEEEIRAQDAGAHHLPAENAENEGSVTNSDNGNNSSSRDPSNNPDSLNNPESSHHSHSEDLVPSIETTQSSKRKREEEDSENDETTQLSKRRREEDDIEKVETTESSKRKREEDDVGKDETKKQKTSHNSNDDDDSNNSPKGGGSLGGGGTPPQGGDTNSGEGSSSSSSTFTYMLLMNLSIFMDEIQKIFFF
nr:hypothetical protein [Neopestalotiopsis cubana]WGO76905.1 hypothetical protein [Neopestalotiopsis cubana]